MREWWWTRNDQGFWCNVCGDHLKDTLDFANDDEMDDFEPERCRQCGAPDEVDPDAI